MGFAEDLTDWQADVQSDMDDWSGEETEAAEVEAEEEAE